MDLIEIGKTIFLFLFIGLCCFNVSVAKALGKSSVLFLLLSIFTTPFPTLFYTVPMAMKLKKEGKWPRKSGAVSQTTVKSPATRKSWQKKFKEVTQRPKSRLSEPEYHDILASAERLQIELQDSARNALNNIYGLTTLEECGKFFRPLTDDLFIDLNEDETVYFREVAAYKKANNLFPRNEYCYSLPLRKGSAYRIGSFSPDPPRQQYLSMGEDGEFLITDQRIIFSGENTNFSISLDKVFKVEVDINGLCIHKTKATAPRVIAMYQYDMALYVLSALINDVPILFVGEDSVANFHEDEVKEEKPRKKKAKSGSPLDDLPKLKKLLDDGVISQEEFDAAKKKALGI